MAGRLTLLFDKFLGLRQHNGVVDYTSGLISAQDANNVELYRYGQGSNTGFRSIKGAVEYAKLGEISDGWNILGHWTSVQDNHENWLVYAENTEFGALFTLDPLTRIFTPIIEEIPKTGKCNGITLMQGFYEYFVFSNGDRLYAVSFGRTPQIELINTTTTTGDTAKGLSLLYQNGRLYINTANRMYYSKKGDIFDFAYTSSLDDGTPDPLNAGFQEFTNNVTAISAFANSIIVFTERDAIAFLGEPATLAFQRLDASLGGTATYLSTLIHDKYLFYFDKFQKNLYMFKQNDFGQRLTGEPIAIEVQPLISSVNPRELDGLKLFSVLQDGRNEIWIILPEVRGNQKILVFDYILKEWTVRDFKIRRDFLIWKNEATESFKTLWNKRNWKIRNSYRDRITGLTVFNNKVYTCAGNIIFAENQGKPIYGSNYKFSIINMGSNTNLKVPKLIPTLTLDNQADNEFWVRIRIDSKERVKEKKITRKFLSSLIFGADNEEDEPRSNLDENDWLAFKTQGQFAVVKLPPITAFKWLELEIFTKTPEENFAIRNFELKRIRIKDKTL